jgi:Phage terminase-like protein, large subunit
VNVWTQVEKRWLDPEDWAGCKGDVDEGALAGRLCFAGLDLASTIDLAAVALVFPPEDGERGVSGDLAVLVPGGSDSRAGA